MHSTTKRIIALFCLLLAAALLAGCGAAALNKPSTTDISKMVTVTGRCDLKIENGKAIVTCSTDVMDNALFKLSINAPSGEQLAYKVIAKSGDNLRAEFDLSNVAERSLYGFALCSPDLDGKQPEEVLQTYGSKFEYIKVDGKNFNWTNDSVRIVFMSGEVKF